MVTSPRAALWDCVGVDSLLRPSCSSRLVPPHALPACSSKRLSELASAYSLWEASTATDNRSAGCVAVRGLAADVSGLNMSLPVKRSVAVLIRNGDRFLSSRRADDDDELPGVWGLPAGSYRGAETLQDLVSRIGREKLGVALIPVRKLAMGRQERQRYVLEMELWETEMVGTPRHPAWKWATAEILRPGESQGSLCCELARGVMK